MPQSLSPEARKHWKDVVPKLVEMGVAKAVDAAALVAMCESWSIYQDLHRYYRRGGVKQRIVLATKLSVAVKTWAAQASTFGMTPSDRARLTVEPDDKTDSFEDMLA